MNKLPTARTNDMVTQDLDKETLLFDIKINKAYCLNETSKIVYQNCDGQTTFEQLKQKSNLTDDLIFLALDQLLENNLIGKFVSPFKNLSRRDVIKSVGLVSLVTLPFISILVVPTAVQAASCLTISQFDCRVTPCCPGLTCFAGIVGPGVCFDNVVG